jgi:hypothetical protein
MGKLKKKFKKKVNPEGSNKMIIAVAIGLMILVAILYITFARGGASVNKKDKKEVMGYALKYLQKGAGVSELKFLPEQNKVVIIYDETIEHLDFHTIARYASLKLSNDLKNEEVSVALVGKHDKEQKENFVVFAKDGTVLRMIEE